MTETKKTGSVVAKLFAMVAIAMGMLAFMQAGMKGHRVGWEEMMLYTGPSVICAIIAISLRRDRDSYIALVFAALSIVGLVQGA